MNDATHALIRVFKLSVFATTLSCGLNLSPGLAPAFATMEDSACFTNPAPECAAPIMQRALALVHAVTHAPERNRALVIFASMQARLGDVAGARKSVDAIQDPVARKSALTHVVSNIAARGTAEETLALAESYGGGWLTGHALYNISARSAISGDIDAARSTAFAITQDDRRAKALDYIVGAQVASGDLTGANATVQNEKNEEIRSQLLLTIGFAHLTTHDLERALKVLGEITGESQQTELLFGLVNAQAQAGNFSGALATAGEIENTQDQETALSEIAAILTFRRDFKGAFAIAHSIADEAIQNAIKVRIAAIRAEAGDVDHALLDARNLDDRSRRDEALHKIAMTLAFGRDTARAIAVAGEIQDDAYKAEIRKNAALAEQRAGNEESALSIARGSSTRSAQVRSLLAIAEHRQRSYASPEDIFLEIESLIIGAENQEIRDESLVEFSASLARVQFFERAINTAQKIAEAPPRGKAKVTIAKSLAFFGEHERAAKVLASIGNPKIRVDAQQSLAMDAVTAGKTAAAMKYSQGIEDPGRRAVVFGFVAETLLRSVAR